MPRRAASSNKKDAEKTQVFETVEEAFARFFPSTTSERMKWKTLESGTELAQRLFARVTQPGRKA